MAMLESPVILVVLPLAAALAALVGKITRLELTASITAVALVASSAVPLVLLAPGALAGTPVESVLGGWRAPLGIVLRMDGFAWIGSALSVLIATLVSIASLPVRGYRATYFLFLSLMVAGMQIVALTVDIFTMFVGFEIIAIAAYLLIAFDRNDAGLLASLKYLILSSVGILFFLVGVFLVYRDTGSLSLDAIAIALRDGGLRDSRSIHLAVAALCVGIGVRTAFVPFHTWLPEAHAYAPHPISALLSGVLIKVSLFAMMRILWVFSAGYLWDALLWIGAGTALLAVIWALSQHDIKRLLAYHSISQMGYILAAFGMGTVASIAGAYSHAIAHALFKSLLFLAAGEVIHVTGTRDLYRMGDLGRRAPVLAGTLLVGALSIAAVPPFVGFASKQFATALISGHPAYWLLWITSVGTVASFIKVGRIVLPAGRMGTATSRPRVHWLAAGPQIALAVACVLAGVLAPRLGATLAQLARPIGASGVILADESLARATAGAFFSGTKLLRTLPVVLLGSLLYVGATSKPGKALASRIAAMRPQIGTVLLFFIAGLVVFAAVATVSAR